MIKLFQRKNISKKNAFFLHIPKTGGSTFVGLLKDSIKITKEDYKLPSHIIDQIGNVKISHIDFSTKHRYFQSPEIFDKSLHLNFKDKFLIFMLIRHPVDRIVSEFTFQYHILNGKDGNTNAAIISKLRPLPNSLKEYIKFPHTHNYQIKFLLGRKIADPKPITASDYQKIIDSIETLSIHCGLTENYSQFLHQFQELTSVKLKKHITIRKRTPIEYEMFLDDALKSKILKYNAYDYKLYSYVKEKLNNKAGMNFNTFKYNNSNDFIV
ncbi:sulfotransferase family 2 domain-containing protein [Oceanihabitans sp. 2_MG-2023]|uniref:sulfotransferase family 2 domain-containing protein n=1 Tax=Oceanihabitans sp. 2_MG-2023 TaxID=3062661 RepID=UPI0026E380D7|nr:sulfotransferase family 2 domain-containing protein [Oceanihabitans sp. 2_MG-2023]MDO6597356.1 sulfotransferase family 2 domain-containing protein [Oceanihabitans sp. 2_MG-2023]